MLCVLNGIRYQVKPDNLVYSVSVLGQEEGYTVKYVPEPKGFPEGAAQVKS